MQAATKGFARTAGMNVASPLDDIDKKIKKGQVSFGDLRREMGHMNNTLRQHNANASAIPTVYRDAAGNARVFLDVNRMQAATMTTLGQRIAYTNALMGGFGRHMINLGKNMQWAGRQVMVGLTLPLVLLGGAATRAAQEYDKQVTRIIKVNNEASAAAARSADEFDLVAQSIRRQSAEITALGASFGFMAAETTKMVAEFSQMGYFGAQLDQLSDAALRLSRVSGSDLDTSLELTRLTAQAFGKDLEDLTETFARLNLVENNTALSLDEMATAMPVVAGVANTMGLEIEQVAGLLAMMKENGISAKEGATALRTGMIQIVQEATDPAIESFAKVGLNLQQMKEDMQTIGQGDIMYFFDELGNHLKKIDDGSDQAQARLNDFTAAIGKLTGTRQAARFLTFLSEIPDRLEEGTVAQRAFIGASVEGEEAMRVYNFELDQVNNSAAGIAERLKAELNFELVKLGENFLVVSNAVRQFAVNIMRWFNGLDDGVKRTVMTFGALVAALGPVTMLLGIMANAFGQIITLVSRILPSMGLVTAAQKAQEAAYLASARAIQIENAMLVQNAALKRGAAGATAMNTGAVASQAAARSGVAGGLTGLTGGALAPSTIAGRGASGVPTAAGGLGIASRASAGAGLPALGGIQIGAAGAQAASKGFMKQLTDALMFIPRQLARGTGAIVGGLTRGIGAALSLIPKGLTAMAAKGGIAGAVGKGALGAGAGIAGAAGGIAAIGLAIAAIPILADPQAFFRSFSEAIGPAFERFKAAFDAIKEGGQRIMELFRQAGGEDSGLGKVASILGTIAGFIGGAILDGLTAFLSLVQPIIDAFEFIFHLVDSIAKLFTGDLSGAGEAFGEAMKAVGRVITGVIAAIIDGIAAVVGAIPGMGGIADAMRDGAQSLREWDFLASNVSTQLEYATQIIRDTNSAQKDLNKSIEDARNIEQDMIRAKLITGNETNNQILRHQHITDEQKTQVLVLREQIELQKQLASVIAGIEALEGRIKAARNADVVSSGEIRFLQDEVTRADRERKAILDDINSVQTRVSTQVAAQRENTVGMVDTFDDYDDMVRQAGEALDDNNDKLKEAEERQRAATRAAQEWMGALKSGMSEVMSDIQSAVMTALARQQEAMQEAFRKRESRTKTYYDNERKRIEGNAERAMKSLNDQIEREKKQDEERERWFRAQKARIDYLQSKDTGNVELQEALARGELARATIIRIRLKAEEEKFFLESYQREEEKHKDVRQNEVEAQKKKIEDTKKLQLDGLKAAEEAALRQLAIEREAAQKGHDARRIAVEQYLRDWMRITPQTEAEFRRHLATLTTNLRGFGISGSQFGSAFSDNFNYPLRSGFQRAMTIARTELAEARKWRIEGDNAGAAFRAGVENQMKKIDASVGKAIVGATGTTAAGRPGGGVHSVRHDGGPAYATPGDGLKPDEGHYILQSGEYVIQRSAVNALGQDYMEAINNVKRYHSGGFIDYSRSNFRDMNQGNKAAGGTFGQQMTQAAVNAIAAGGAKPKRSSFYTSSGRDAQAVGEHAGKQMRKAVEENMIFTGTAGGAGPQSAAGSGWPARTWGRVAANTASALRFIQNSNWGGKVGAFTGHGRGDRASDHSYGKAIDAMITRAGTMPNANERRTGWNIANWFLGNAGRFGTKYVIWDKLIKNPREKNWRPYTRYGNNPGPTLGHYDHPHISFLHSGGMVTPGLRNGGRIKMDNTIANLHRGETVLTAPLTEQFERAISRMADGGGNSYHLEINVNGGNIDEQKLARKVVTEIKKMDRLQTRGRKVS